MTVLVLNSKLKNELTIKIKKHTTLNKHYLLTKHIAHNLHCRIVELNKMCKFIYCHNYYCHIAIREKIHVIIKTNINLCVTLYDLSCKSNKNSTDCQVNNVIQQLVRC